MLLITKTTHVMDDVKRCLRFTVGAFIRMFDLSSVQGYILMFIAYHTLESSFLHLGYNITGSQHNTSNLHKLINIFRSKIPQQLGLLQVL